MGIEPTLSAWEAEVLPLNYTRPTPRGKTQYPLAGILHHPRRVRLTDLSCDRSPDGSLHAFASGQSFHPLSAPLQDGIRFFHHPLPTTAADNLTVTLVRQTGRTPRWAYHVPYKQQSWEGSVISPVITCQRVRTKQANNRSHAFWQSPMKQVAFGSFKLYDVYQRFAYANQPTQPNASFGCNCRNHAATPHGIRRTPQGGYIVRALSTPPLPVTHRS